MPSTSVGLAAGSRSLALAGACRFSARFHLARRIQHVLGDLCDRNASRVRRALHPVMGDVRLIAVLIVRFATATT